MSWLSLRWEILFGTALAPLTPGLASRSQALAIRVANGIRSTSDAGRVVIRIPFHNDLDAAAAWPRNRAPRAGSGSSLQFARPIKVEGLSPRHPYRMESEP